MPIKFKLVKPVDDYNDVTLQYGTQFKIIGVRLLFFQTEYFVFSVVVDVVGFMTWSNALATR